MGKHLYKNCTIIECEGIHHALGLCRKHYERKKRHGSCIINRRENNIGSLQEVFNKYCNKKNDNECWPWNGLISKQGYGRLIHKKKEYKAHRVAYELRNGIVDVEIFICHSCDNTRCVNPAHLWPGTHQDNMTDMLKKRRKQHGELCWNAKLSNELVKRIRKEFFLGEK